MLKKYLVTGATGFLGSTIIEKLSASQCQIRALVLPDDPLEKHLPKCVEIVHGSVDNAEDVNRFLYGDLAEWCLIHCAGIISIASGENKYMDRVNVAGTQILFDACYAKKIAKVIYVSTVHAIPELPKGQIITEIDNFSPNMVVGHYAKSKAAATDYALKMAGKGLPLSVVHPSGIIGPRDWNMGNISAVIWSYCKGKLPCSVAGGYDFVDVRDVAEGVLACASKGKNATCYILSNRYISINDILTSIRSIINGRKLLFEVPGWFVRAISPLCEKISLLNHRTLFLTPYSAYTLQSNSLFSHARASRELGYKPRSIEKTLKDTVKWLCDNQR